MWGRRRDAADSCSAVIAEQSELSNRSIPDYHLGLGRAAGTDPLRRSPSRDPMIARHFPEDIQELQSYSTRQMPRRRSRPIRAADSRCRCGYSVRAIRSPARCRVGLRMRSPRTLLGRPDEALAIYRERFQPSKQLEQGLRRCRRQCHAADTDEEARYLFTSMQQMFPHASRQTRQIPAPIDDMDAFWTPEEKMTRPECLPYPSSGHRILFARHCELLEKRKPTSS